ncbi:hypothetical protein COV11_04140 [Candidatus Woesearchaeota archaeon CG10_big_fil_rev_8_21_14_0_10_30_7]|nr:MAG: hypothetical protein COV11_04140 [Candidatus Woesearchaeota archaeon CG10_big_fil_rev_8_21_14_0_10_30_7]
MKKVSKLWFISILLIFLIPLVSAKFSYYVQINYDNGELNYQDLEVITGETPVFVKEKEDEYDAHIFDFLNNELFNFSFEIPRIIYDVPGVFWLNESFEILTIPYFNKGKVMKIYDSENNLKLEINLAHLAMCNQNYICEPNKENHKNCAIDCVIGGKDDLCEDVIDGVCDPDCSSSQDLECEYALSDITEEKVINDLITIYEGEIKTYEGIPKAKQQITIREERIKNLKTNNSLFLILSLILLLILTLIFIKVKKK